MALNDVDDKEKKKMMSRETRMGIEMTGMLFSASYLHALL